jgi:nucleotide-binding universal stress UspA family protein
LTGDALTSYDRHQQNDFDGEVMRMNWVLSTIVVPSDGSASAEAQLASARALARATGARIVVTHINELVRGHLSAHSVHACEAELEAGVREQVESLRRAGVRADLALHSSSKDVARAIADVATSCDADLIVTRKGRRSALLSLVSGNMSRRLVQLARCPVLVVS